MQLAEISGKNPTFSPKILTFPEKGIFYQPKFLMTFFLLLVINSDFRIFTHFLSKTTDNTYEFLTFSLLLSR